jgi:hypothetical protein
MRAGVLCLLGVAATLLFTATQAPAGTLTKPDAAPILTVSGNIANKNEGEVARFDRQMLESLGTVTIRTWTPWYEHVVEFEGVPMKRLMESVGAAGSQVTATALNDYQSTIPMSDFEQFGVILALKRDGREMPIRDKGPLFIVYPYDSDPGLRSDQYYSRSVWQVKELEVR